MSGGSCVIWTRAGVEVHFFFFCGSLLEELPVPVQELTGRKTKGAKVQMYPDELSLSLQ